MKICIQYRFSDNSSIFPLEMYFTPQIIMEWQTKTKNLSSVKIKSVFIFGIIFFVGYVFKSECSIHSIWTIHNRPKYRSTKIVNVDNNMFLSRFNTHFRLVMRHILTHLNLNNMSRILTFNPFHVTVWQSHIYVNVEVCQSMFK